jgi:hypothetical protein
MKKIIPTLASAASAFFFLSSCSDVKDAVTENCLFYTTEGIGDETLLKCEENTPIGTCSELAVGITKTRVVKSCPEIKFTENCHLFYDLNGTKTTIECKENIPVNTCSEFAGVKAPGTQVDAEVQTEVVPSCSGISSGS